MGDHAITNGALAQTRVLRFLHRIHERERAAVPEIQAQLEAAPSGEYRDALARHLAETRDHIPMLVQASNIADYHTLERLAEAAQDRDTQALAGRLGEQEQGTFNRIMEQIPALSEALAR